MFDRWLRLLAVGVVVGAAAAPATPATVLDAAPAADWRMIDAASLLVIEVAGGRVVVMLDDSFAPLHAAHVRALARAHWYDGLAVDRVQDNYVAQWGDAEGTRTLPAAIAAPIAAEYERAAAGLAFHPLEYRDTYADRVGIVQGMPAAMQGGRAWPVHCYGVVGVGRDFNPDTGTGAELYAVIGQAPRALDRNIAVVGRVASGIAVLAALPRGDGELGFYADPARRVPIARVRLAADLPAADRPRLQILDAGSASYAAWVRVRAHRMDRFYQQPADALDICNAMPPVRPAR